MAQKDIHTKMNLVAIQVSFIFKNWVCCWSFPPLETPGCYWVHITECFHVDPVDPVDSVDSTEYFSILGRFSNFVELKDYRWKHWIFSIFSADWIFSIFSNWSSMFLEAIWKTSERQKASIWKEYLRIIKMNCLVFFKKQNEFSKFWQFSKICTPRSPYRQNEIW